MFVCNMAVLRSGIILQSMRDFVPRLCNWSLFVFYKQIQFLQSLSSCAIVPVVPQAQGLRVHSSCSVTALLPAERTGVKHLLVSWSPTKAHNRL